MRTIGCEECRELLLSAEPDTLQATLGRGGGGITVAAHPAASADAELREHLHLCARCAELAAAVLAENAALDNALAQLTLESGQRASQVWQPEAAAPGAVRARGASPGSHRRRPNWPAALIPLAAAAALLLVWRPRLPDRLPPLAGPVEEVPATPVVNAAGARGVAVMRTNDPNITIVWTF